MRNIDQHNINEWFFDLVEGNLTKSEKSVLYAYVEKNQQYQHELDLWLGSVYKNTAPLEMPNMANLYQKQGFFSIYGKYLIPLLFVVFVGTGYYFLNNSSELNSQTEVTTQVKNVENTELTDRPKEIKELAIRPTKDINTSINSSLKAIPNNESTSIKDERTFEELDNLTVRNFKFESSYYFSKKLEPVEEQNVSVQYGGDSDKKKKSQADIIEIQNTGF